MRRLSIIILALVLALSALTVSAAPAPDEIPGLAKALAALEAHNPNLLNTPGVAGTAVTLGTNGSADVTVFLEHAGVAGIPASLDGLRVKTEVTGKFTAIKSPAATGTRTTATTVWARPVPTGISTGNANEVSAGTIAARVKDAAGNVYALSNNHVYSRENNAAIGEEVLQPGLYDTNGVYNSANHLGYLTNFVPLNYSGGANYVDAAIASTDVSLLGNSTPVSIGGYGAPSSSITAASLNMAVQKFGRTTQSTKGTITGVSASINVSYTYGTALFQDQIIVTSKKPFIKSGDSGSLLVTNDSSASPVGLLFAGNSNGNMAVANRIDLVLNSFGVTIDGK